MRREETVRRIARTRQALGALSIAMVFAPVLHPWSAAGAQQRSLQASSWVTYPDQSKLLARQPNINFTYAASQGPTISVDDNTRFQSVEGIGASMTESSASLLMQLPVAQRNRVMSSLFNATSGIGLTYLRQPVGASDFATGIYSLDDTATPDPTLTHFSVTRDQSAVLPLIRAARKLSPQLKLMLTPWSAPAWMKTSGSATGGTLSTSDQQVYAEYLTRAVAAYAANGAPVQALTLQNEPTWTPWDYPGMTLTVSQEASLAAAVRSTLDRAGFAGVQLIGHDDNWSQSDRAIELLRGASALSGVAFHCYRGDPSSQSAVHDATGKDIYLSECTGGDWGLGFAGDLDWAVRNLVIDGFRNWARTLTLWNVALDPSHGPHTGGCTDCRGLLTVDPSTGRSSANPEYYALGQVAKFVRPGAVRVSSSDDIAGLRSVAFRNRDGSHVLVVLNDGWSSTTFQIGWSGQYARSALPAGGVATFTW